MKKNFCLIFFVILNILLISCKEKKIDETNESDFVSLNKEKVTDTNLKISLIQGEELVIKKGKKIYHKIIVM